MADTILEGAKAGKELRSAQESMIMSSLSFVPDPVSLAISMGVSQEKYLISCAMRNLRLGTCLP